MIYENLISLAKKNLFSKDPSLHLTKEKRHCSNDLIYYIMLRWPVTPHHCDKLISNQR